MAPIIASLAAGASSSVAKWLALAAVGLGLVAWGALERAGRFAAEADAAAERGLRLIAEQAAVESSQTARRLADLYAADQDRVAAELAAARAREAKVRTIVKEVTRVAPNVCPAVDAPALPRAVDPAVGPAVAAALDGLRRLRADRENGRDP